MESDRRVVWGNFIPGDINWKRHFKTVSKLEFGGEGSGGEIVHFGVLTAPIHDLIACKCPTIPKPGQSSHSRRGEKLRKFRRIKYLGTLYKKVCRQILWYILSRSWQNWFVKWRPIGGQPWHCFSTSLNGFEKYERELNKKFELKFCF